MTYHVDPEWWKHIFDDLYLLTDARSVCDEMLTKREVDLLFQITHIPKESKILDLCGGQGRHSLELYRRGYGSLTVLDYSEYLIGHGKRSAEKEGAPIQFIQGDARSTVFPSSTFDCVLIFGNSLGYFSSGDGDLEILKEALRVLKTGGIFMADVTNGEDVKKNFNPLAWHEIGDDTVVCRKRKIEGEMIITREVVLSKSEGLKRDSCYSLRLYGPESLKGLVLDAGFSEVTVVSDFSPHREDGDYGFMNSRMVVTAKKEEIHQENPSL